MDRQLIIKLKDIIKDHDETSEDKTHVEVVYNPKGEVCDFCKIGPNMIFRSTSGTHKDAYVQVIKGKPVSLFDEDEILCLINKE
jgi:hypothetical protein